MLNNVQQIVSAYEQAGLNPEQIQESLFPDYSVEVIEQVLLQNSQKRRDLLKGVGKQGDKPTQAFLDESGISEDDFHALRRRMMNIALHSDNEEVAYKAAKFLYNEKKGRNDVKSKIVVNNNQKIIMFNEELAKARQKLAALESHAIDIVSNPAPTSAVG